LKKEEKTFYKKWKFAGSKTGKECYYILM